MAAHKWKDSGRDLLGQFLDLNRKAETPVTIARGGGGRGDLDGVGR